MFCEGRVSIWAISTTDAQDTYIFRHCGHYNTHTALCSVVVNIILDYIAWNGVSPKISLPTAYF